MTRQIPEDVRQACLASILPPTAAPSDAHKLLADMPFLGALNSSLDQVLAVAFHSKSLVATDSAELISALQARTMFVANVSGSVSQPSSVLLNSRQFNIQLSDKPQFKQFLTTLFLRYHTLFVRSASKRPHVHDA